MAKQFAIRLSDEFYIVLFFLLFLLNSIRSKFGMNRMKLTICSRTVLWKICSRISVNSSSSSGPISMSSMVMVAVLTNVYFDEFFSAVFTLESAAAANRFAIKCSNTNIWCKFKASLSLLRLKNVRTRSHELTHWNNWLETGWWLVFLSFFLFNCLNLIWVLLFGVSSVPSLLLFVGYYYSFVVNAHLFTSC